LSILLGNRRGSSRKAGWSLVGGVAAILLSLTPMSLQGQASPGRGTGKPTLQSAHILGGSGDSSVSESTVDSIGNIYIVGSTLAPDFPTLHGLNMPLPTEWPSTQGFITKFAPDGKTILFSTLIGGSGEERMTDIAIASDGTILIAGFTNSIDFPVTDGSTDESLGSVFVARIDPAQPALLFSRRINGSSERDLATSLVLDEERDRLWLTAYTYSPDLPLVAPLSAVPSTIYVAAVRPTDGTIQFATYLGERDADPINFDSALGKDGTLYLGGMTFISRQIDPGAGGPIVLDRQGYVLALSLEPTPSVSSTLFGGMREDWIQGISLLSDGRLVVVGRTGSTDFPTTPDAYQQTDLNPGHPGNEEFPATGGDAFMTILSTDGRSVVYSTYLGGAALPPMTEYGGGSIALTVTSDADDNVYVGGGTSRAAFPSKRAIQPASGGEADAFIAKFAGSTYRLSFSTYLGGGRDDTIQSLVLHPQGQLVAVGTTSSRNFPATGENPVPPTGGFVAIIQTHNPRLLSVDTSQQGNGFKITLRGENFRSTSRVYVGDDTTPWPTVVYKDGTSLILKGGEALEARFPVGTPVRIRVENPSGEQTSSVFTRS
jgi:hypothetical protein